MKLLTLAAVTALLSLPAHADGVTIYTGAEAGADQAGCGSDVADADDQPGNTAAPGAPEPVSGDDAPAGNDGDDDGA